MPDDTLRVIVRTPQGCVFDARVRSLRVPTDTGQVGLRPRAERAALAVEPGLVLAAGADGLHFIATAGGLLRCGGLDVVLVTPLAVTGASADAVSRELDRVLAASSAEFALRAVLQRLEAGILAELRRTASAPAAERRRG